VSTKLIVYPYSLGSTSARHLAGELSTIRVRGTGNYHYRPGHLIINWGNSNVPRWGSVQAMNNMLNKPQLIRNAAEKVRTFQALAQALPADMLPQWTTSRHTAEGWLRNPIYGRRKNAVLCRTLTRAHAGRGIVLADRPEQLVAAPLYTRYKPKSTEFRIHVFARFGIIDAQEKRKRNDVVLDEISKYVRSHDNHWVFCRDGISVPARVRDAAERAVHALDLDFGAVDIGFHDDLGVAVYEINTAPGIEGQTLNNYVNTFRRFLA
jgi:hypothetical protein